MIPVYSFCTFNILPYIPAIALLKVVRGLILESNQVIVPESDILYRT